MGKLSGDSFEFGKSVSNLELLAEPFIGCYDVAMPSINANYFINVFVFAFYSNFSNY